MSVGILVWEIWFDNSNINNGIDDILYVNVVILIYRMDAPDISIFVQNRLNQNQLEYLYTVNKKLEDVIQWISNKSCTVYHSNASISIDSIIVCELRCRYNIGNEISFRLQTKKYSQLIRMFHHQPGQKHENPDGIVYMDVDHKHYNREEIIYPVSNIDTLNINDALLGFLKECNISSDPIHDIIPLRRPFRFLTTLDYFVEEKNGRL